GVRSTPVARAPSPRGDSIGARLVVDAEHFGGEIMPPTGSQTFTVPFGRGSVSFALPAGVEGIVARSRAVAPLDDPIAAAHAAVRSPLGTVRLRELATGKRRVCIAVTDATRACPDHLLVP